MFGIIKGEVEDLRSVNKWGVVSGQSLCFD